LNEILIRPSSGKRGVSDRIDFVHLSLQQLVDPSATHGECLCVRSVFLADPFVSGEKEGSMNDRWLA